MKNYIPYIVTRRARFLAICGQVNLPYGTIVFSDGDFLVINDEKLCSITSQNAFDYFSRNDDGNGLKRGNLVREIKSQLEKRDGKYQDRWDVVWSDSVANRLRKKDSPDFWIWSTEFYNADIFELQHIENLIKSKSYRK